MLQSWQDLQAYAFPLFALIPWVLAKVRQTRNLHLTLIAPFWPQRAWFPDLLNLLTEVPVPLPVRPRLLKQPHMFHFHQNLQMLALHA